MLKGAFKPLLLRTNYLHHVVPVVSPRPVDLATLKCVGV